MKFIKKHNVFEHRSFVIVLCFLILFLGSPVRAENYKTISSISPKRQDRSINFRKDSLESEFYYLIVIYVSSERSRNQSIEENRVEEAEKESDHPLSFGTIASVVASILAIIVLWNKIVILFNQIKEIPELKELINKLSSSLSKLFFQQEHNSKDIQKLNDEFQKLYKEFLTHQIRSSFQPENSKDTQRSNHELQRLYEELLSHQIRLSTQLEQHSKDIEKLIDKTELLNEKFLSNQMRSSTQLEQHSKDIVKLIDKTELLNEKFLSNQMRSSTQSEQSSKDIQEPEYRKKSG